MRFKIVNIVTGKTTECVQFQISHNISPDCEILRYKSDGSLEAIGFVSYEVMTHFVNKFASFIYDKYSVNKDVCIAAMINTVSEYLNKRITINEFKAIISNLNNTTKEIIFQNGSVTDSIIANNVFIAATCCTHSFSGISDLPKYCISAISEESRKHEEVKAQSNYILSYFESVHDSVI